MANCLLDIGVYGLCREFPKFSVRHRRPLENTTVPVLIDPGDEGPNATTAVDSTAPSQAVVVDPSGSH